MRSRAFGWSRQSPSAISRFKRISAAWLLVFALAGGAKAAGTHSSGQAGGAAGNGGAGQLAQTAGHGPGGGGAGHGGSGGGNSGHGHGQGAGSGSTSAHNGSHSGHGHSGRGGHGHAGGSGHAHGSGRTHGSTGKGSHAHGHGSSHRPGSTRHSSVSAGSRIATTGGGSGSLSGANRLAAAKPALVSTGPGVGGGRGSPSPGCSAGCGVTVPASGGGAGLVTPSVTSAPTGTSSVLAATTHRGASPPAILNPKALSNLLAGIGPSPALRAGGPLGAFPLLTATPLGFTAPAAPASGTHRTAPASTAPVRARLSASRVPDVIQRIERVVPEAVWIALGTALLMAAVAAGTALWTGARVRRQAGRFAALSEAALTDPLTGVVNRRGFIQAAEQELERAKRYGRPLAIAYVDVRGLKAVNDTEGHSAGDGLLRSVARLLQDSARANDVVGRLGGDELGLLLIEQGREGADAVANRVHAEVLSRRSSIGLRSHWDLTVGTATHPEDGDSVESLLRTADLRLYEQRGIELR